MGQELKVEKIYPLSPMQEGMLFHYLVGESKEAYFEQVTYEITGELDLKCFEKSFNILINRHEVFRTVFIYEGLAKPQQVVLRERQTNIDFIDIAYMSEYEKKEYIEAFKNEDKQKGFNLSKDIMIRISIIRTGEYHYTVIWSHHHIIMDGWCLGIVTREFFEVYNSLKNDIPLNLEKTHPYQDFIKWVGAQNKQDADKYWQSYLIGFEQQTGLPLDKKNKENEKYELQEEIFSIDDYMFGRLKTIARGNGVTLNTVVQAIWGLLLCKYNNVEDVVFGSVVSGRPSEISDVERMVGLFINTIPVRIKYENKSSLSRVMKEIQQNALKSERYSYYPLAEIQAKSSAKSGLISHIMVFENYPLEVEARNAADSFDTGFSIDKVQNFEQTNYNFNILVIPGNELTIMFKYNSNVYSRTIVNMIRGHFEKLINQVAENNNITVNDMDIMTNEEKYIILNNFVGPSAEYPSSKTINVLFEEQAGKTPDNTAVIFGDKHLTYRELNVKANRLAGVLREKGARSDSIIAIMAERSLGMMVGIMGILKSGAAYLPISPDYPEERIKYMLEDSGAGILLTQESFKNIKWFNGDVLILEDEQLYKGNASNLSNVNNPDDLAYIIYTSGSTGKPKGVMIEHRSIVNRLNWMQKMYPLGVEDTILQKTPFTFDVSVWELFWWSLAGARVCLLEPGGEKDPGAIVQAVEKNSITTIHFVPSMLNIFLGHIKEWGREDGLISLRQVFASGEALSAKQANTFNSLLYKRNGTKLHNLYGPTEASVDVSYFDCSTGEELEVVPIGKPIDNINIYILDKENRLQPVGISGELCISGIGVGRGYLNKEELTKEKFVEDPFKDGERMYRTGDLARWMSDGNIEYLGRMDNQVKIRGYRIELGEIEAQLLKHETVKEAVVAVKEHTDEDKMLCAYVVSNEALDISELRKSMQKELPDYMVPAFIMKLDNLPLTHSGKVDRKALPDPHENLSDSEYEGPANEMEAELMKIWMEVLGLERIGVNDNFFMMGGHSLKLLGLVSNIHKRMNIEVPLKELFKRPTIRGLAEFVKESEKNIFLPIEPAEDREYYPVSSAQKRMYILNNFVNSGINYNLPAFVWIEGNFEIERFEWVINELVKRHDSLRTSFEMIEGEIVQKIHSDVDFKITCSDSNEEDLDNVVKTFIQPFDLSKAPLLRVAILKVRGNKCLLMYDMHHIISDGASMEVLLKEISVLYHEKTLPGLRIQYKDFAIWQTANRDSDFTKKHKEYWKEIYSGDIPVLDIATDFPRPSIQEFAGNTLSFNLGKDLTDKLKELVTDTDTTLFMVLLAVYNILLFKYTGQDDIVVGSPITGRPHADLENIIGMFVNMLPIRCKNMNKLFIEFLKDVKENSLNAIEHQSYQFEDLVEELNIKRDLSRNPIFDTMLVFQSLNNSETVVEGFSFSNYVRESTVSKFDLSLYAYEKIEGLCFALEYRTKLFKKETIERMAGHFINIIRQVVEKPDKKISDIELALEEERHRILNEFNNTVSEYIGQNTLHQVFEEQAGKTPDNRSVIFGDKHLTYRELNEKTNRLAVVLREKGARPDSIIAIMVERSLEMMVGIMGILKSGAAYLPISPDYPEERVKYMLEDSGTYILLTQKRFSSSLGFEGNILYLDDEELYSGEGSNLENVNKSDDLAYMIYTSGSTGRPKGVMIEHRSIINKLNWMQKIYPLGVEDTILQKTSFTFDVSVWELFWWTFAGAKICFLKPDGEKDPGAIVETVEKNSITVIHFVPSMLNTFLEYIKEWDSEERLRSLKHVFASGEALSARQANIFNSLLYKRNGTKLHNLYGPTEAAVEVSYFDCSAEGEELKIVPIGKPIDNIRLYILDKDNRLQPVGIPGELCISGIGVGRGYLNKEELTKEKFVEDPFKDGERMYRTGDLARWMSDGNIEYLGRMDNQVKIRGYRIELGEIEAQLLKHETVKEAVVAVKEHTDEDKMLCAYVVSNEALDISELRKSMQKELPDYMVPAFIMKLDNLPLTHSGKVDRKALPDPQENLSDSEYEGPANEMEAELIKIWMEVLGIERIGVNDNFFMLGGHSLKATKFITLAYKRLQTRIPLKVIFERPTIRELSGYIEQNDHTYSPIQKVETRPYYHASSSQKRFFLIYQSKNDDISYNMPFILKIEGNLDRERFETAIKGLVERHETLRTSFEIVEGEVVQKINSDANFDIEFSTIAESEVEKSMALFVRPFDLTKGPLIRVTLAKLTDMKHILMIDIHHIICDGVSINILISEFIKLYNGEKLTELRIQYKDFAEWQKELLRSEEREKQEKYWHEKFSGIIPVLDLPTDYPRPGKKGTEGSKIKYELDNVLTSQLYEMAIEYETTIYMILLAAFNILLSKYSGQQDIVIGTPSAGRIHPDLQNVIGLFVNTLPMRNSMTNNKAFNEFLREVKENTLAALENQDYQFEELVVSLGIKTDMSRNPLFDVMFMLQNFNQVLKESTDLIFTEYDYQKSTSKFDLNLIVSEGNENLILVWEYSVRLFKEETIQNFIRSYEHILKEIIQNPGVTISQIDLSKEEKQRIIFDFNDDLEYAK